MPIIIPIDAHIITLLVFKKPEPSKWKPAFIKQVVDASTALWNKAAGISFSLRSTVAEAPIELIHGSSTVDDEGFFFLRAQFPPKKDNTVSMLLINSFSSGSNLGKSVESLITCAISYYTSTVDPNGKNLSHELGHLLSLPHIKRTKDPVRDVSNLMYEGAHLTQLEPEQVKAAQNSPLAKRFGGT
ncbi:MAG: hypothetical protein JWQ09_837 [Segetibacter sp.]|nr:hypothetical protein [Segetibacter sp.]